MSAAEELRRRPRSEGRDYYSGSGNDDSIILSKSRGAVVADQGTICQSFKAIVLHEVPDHGHFRGIAVVGTEDTLAPLHHWNASAVHSLVPNIQFIVAAVPILFFIISQSNIIETMTTSGMKD